MRGWRKDLGGKGGGGDWGGGGGGDGGGWGEERVEERSGGGGADEDVTGGEALREARAGGWVRYCRIARARVAGLRVWGREVSVGLSIAGIYGVGQCL